MSDQNHVSGPSTSTSDLAWNPADYDRFRGLRLRPALDLLAQIPALPDGDIVDLGCGSGAVGAPLATRFPGRRLRGVDRASSMLEEAEALGVYDVLEVADIANWDPGAPVALIFANAALNWLPDHDQLLPALAEHLVPGGMLAVQSPKQQEAPSHALLRDLSSVMFPDRFDWHAWRDDVLDMPQYSQILDGIGAVSLWETTYAQRMAPVETGHPVRHFTQSTAGRRVLERLDETESAAFLAAYDTALEQVYPLRSDGSVLFPFRRIFFTLERARD